MLPRIRNLINASGSSEYADISEVIGGNKQLQLQQQQRYKSEGPTGSTQNKAKKRHILLKNQAYQYL